MGKIPILTNIFQMGWFNHQLVYCIVLCYHNDLREYCETFQEIKLFPDTLAAHTDASSISQENMLLRGQRRNLCTSQEKDPPAKISKVAKILHLFNLSMKQIYVIQ